MTRGAFIGLVAFLSLSGCETVLDAGNELGQYMPEVAGDRCESTECFTTEGKARSEAVKAERLRRQQEQALKESGKTVPAPKKKDTPSPFDTVTPF